MCYAASAERNMAEGERTCHVDGLRTDVLLLRSCDVVELAERLVRDRVADDGWTQDHVDSSSKDLLEVFADESARPLRLDEILVTLSERTKHEK